MAPGEILLLTELVALLVVPPLGYLLWIRLSERHNREPVPALLSSFGYGATAGIALALLLNQAFQVGFGGSPFGASLNDVMIASVVMAPLVEELAKSLGMAVSRPHILEIEDGILHGAAIGLGFAATENAIYAGQALLASGLDISVQTTALRVVSSMVLHATAAGLVGFGYSQVRVGGMSRLVLIPCYFGAAALHASYNFLVQLPEALAWFGFALALIITLSAALALRQRVHYHDRKPKPVAWTGVLAGTNLVNRTRLAYIQVPVPLDARLQRPARPARPSPHVTKRHPTPAPVQTVRKPIARPACRRPVPGIAVARKAVVKPARFA